MFKIPKKLITTIFTLQCACFLLPTLAASSTEYTISVSPPRFVLPQFTGPYREREASIAPEEYETANKLRALLANDKKQEVLKELDAFYDIELSPAMLTLKAQIYFSLKMYEQAEAKFLKVLARKPELVRVHSDLAQLYLLQNKHKKARHHFAKAITFGSNDPIVHGQLGYLNLTMHGPFSAISEYQKAMALEPEDLQWQQGLLAALSQAKMYQAAQALLSEMLAKRPQEKYLWLNQASLALNVNDIKQALVALEMAILLGDDNENNLKTAAQIHLQLDSYDRALVLINRHLNESSLNIETLNEYLTWLDQAKMWQQASTLLDSITPRLKSMTDAEQSLIYMHRAKLSSKQNKFHDADKNYLIALEKNPSNGNALLNYALFSSEQKNHVEAELLYIRAEAIVGIEKQALLGRAQLYINMQDYPAALMQLKSALRRYPELNDLTDQIKAIESIIQMKKSSTI